MADFRALNIPRARAAIPSFPKASSYVIESSLNIAMLAEDISPLSGQKSAGQVGYVKWRYSKYSHHNRNLAEYVFLRCVSHVRQAGPLDGYVVLLSTPRVKASRTATRQTQKTYRQGKKSIINTLLCLLKRVRAGQHWITCHFFNTVISPSVNLTFS